MVSPACVANIPSIGRSDKMTRILSPRMVVLGVFALLAASLSRTSAKQSNNDDIGGTVTSSAGPEAGVWVIAETNDLPTHYIKEVVTDDKGRYLIPDLPKARRSEEHTSELQS